MVDAHKLGTVLAGNPHKQLTSLNELLYKSSFDIANIINLLFTKQATLMRRSTVLSLPFQLIFSGSIYVALPKVAKVSKVTEAVIVKLVCFHFGMGWDGSKIFLIYHIIIII